MSNENQTIINKEEEILKQEKEILQEIKKEEKAILGWERKFFLTAVLAAILIIGSLAAVVYWRGSSSRIYIEKAQITAPKIDLSATVPGLLEEVYVNEGDIVLPNTVVARIGGQLIKTKNGGLVIDVNKDIGKLFGAGQAVVSVIDPNELRVVGNLEEDKGLQDVSVGQGVMFTVDTYGSKKYYGVVDEISPTSNDTGVVFSISDKRPVKEFLVKARFDIAAYGELKNGMSAKMWIYKK